MDRYYHPFGCLGDGTVSVGGQIHLPCVGCLGERIQEIESQLEQKVAENELLKAEIRKTELSAMKRTICSECGCSV